MSALTTSRKRLLSGMKPTGTGALHLGNLEGALMSWVRLQDQYEMFCFVADWHSLTTLYEDPSTIAEGSRQVAADYIAAGIDPEKCAAMFEGMLAMDEVLRQSGQYGPRVDVPHDADVQTKLIAFTGRTP